MLKKLKENLLVVRAVFMREMAYWVRYPSWIFTFLALPYLVSGLFYGIGYAVGGARGIQNFSQRTGTTNALLYYLIGSVVFMVSTTMIDDIGTSIRDEQLRGTFELQYLTPANKLVLWSSVIIPHSLFSFLTLLIATVPPLILAGLRTNPLLILVSLIVLFIGILPLFGIGLFLAAITVRFKEPQAITNTIGAFISAFSGFYYPLTIFPLWLQYTAYLLPTTVVTDLFRSTLLFNRNIFLSNYRLSILLIMSIAYPLIGLSFYKRWEIYAKRSGGLSKY